MGGPLRLVRFPEESAITSSVLLISAVVTSFVFGQLFKWSQRCGCFGPTVVTVNYLVAAAAIAGYLWWNGGIELSPAVVEVGGVIGLSFILSMFLMTWALSVSDAATIFTAFRISIVVPIAFSLVLWDEEVSMRQLTGVALALAALVLMSGGLHGDSRQSMLRHAGLAFAVWLLQGISHTCARWVHHAGLDEFQLEVLLVTAATAGLLGMAVLAMARNWPTASSVKMGAGIGIFNAFALAIFLATLARFSSAQFFPITGCAIVIMDNVVAHVVWRERVSLLSAIGAVVGATAMLLVF